MKDFKLSAEGSAYAVVHPNSDVLKASSSGGAFSLLASSVLKRNGAVYGCVFDKNMTARHIRVDCEDELVAMQGSKYVQSEMGTTYLQVREDLHAGVPVLFTGTPCQVDGLRAFLGGQDEGLLCADLVCHGVPSGRMLSEYLDTSYRKNGSVKRLLFRNKRLGWSCGGGVLTEQNGQEKWWPLSQEISSYYDWFLSGDSYRECCYRCPYAQATGRPGDFTIADFWGVSSEAIDFDTSCGVSLVLVNTERGREAAKEIFNGCVCVQRPIEEAIRENHQLSHPVERRLSRDEMTSVWVRKGMPAADMAWKHKHWFGIVKWHVKSFIKRILGRSVV